MAEIETGVSPTRVKRKEILVVTGGAGHSSTTPSERVMENVLMSPLSKVSVVMGMI